MTNNAVLKGIRVLDLTSVLMGPLATQMLGDMGADVIKIESPEGDIARTAGLSREKGMAALFMGLNRNKRSVVLDLQLQQGREAMQRLVAASDVVVHSIRRSALGRLGLNYETLTAQHPGLIYCHLKGFSDSGLYAGQPAFDDMIQALSGLADLQTPLTGEPRFVPSFLADKVCGIYAAHALGMALFHKARTGQGQQVSLPMFETMAAFNLLEHMGGHAFEPPLGPLGFPSLRRAIRRPQRTKDGHISLWPVTDAQWNRFFALIGEPELATDLRMSTLSARMQHPDEVLALFDRVLPKRTSAEWIEVCQLHDLPIAKVNRLEDLLDEPHLSSVNFWSTQKDQSGSLLRALPNSISLSETPPSIRLPPPRLGQHTEEVLREFSFTPAEIDALAEAGAAPRMAD